MRGFCKSTTIEDIASHGFVLTPGRYVGAEETEDDTELFEEKMNTLVSQLTNQSEKSASLDKAILRNLRDLGYGA